MSRSFLLHAGLSPAPAPPPIQPPCQLLFSPSSLLPSILPCDLTPASAPSPFSPPTGSNLPTAAVVGGTVASVVTLGVVLTVAGAVATKLGISCIPAAIGLVTSVVRDASNVWSCVSKLFPCLVPWTKRWNRKNGLDDEDDRERFGGGHRLAGDQEDNEEEGVAATGQRAKGQNRNQETDDDGDKEQGASVNGTADRRERNEKSEREGADRLGKSRDGNHVTDDNVNEEAADRGERNEESEYQGGESTTNGVESASHEHASSSKTATNEQTPGSKNLELVAMDEKADVIALSSKDATKNDRTAEGRGKSGAVDGGIIVPVAGAGQRKSSSFAQQKTKSAADRGEAVIASPKRSSTSRTEPRSLGRLSLKFEVNANRLGCFMLCNAGSTYGDQTFQNTPLALPAPKRTKDPESTQRSPVSSIHQVKSTANMASQESMDHNSQAPVIVFTEGSRSRGSSIYTTPGSLRTSSELANYEVDTPLPGYYQKQDPMTGYGASRRPSANPFDSFGRMTPEHTSYDLEPSAGRYQQRYRPTSGHGADRMPPSSNNPFDEYLHDAVDSELIDNALDPSALSKYQQRRADPNAAYASSRGSTRSTVLESMADRRSSSDVVTHHSASPILDYSQQMRERLQEYRSIADPQMIIKGGMESSEFRRNVSAAPLPPLYRQTSDPVQYGRPRRRNAANAKEAMNYDGETSFSEYSQRSEPRFAVATDPVEFAGGSTSHFPNAQQRRGPFEGYRSSRESSTAAMDPILIMGGMESSEFRSDGSAAPLPPIYTQTSNPIQYYRPSRRTAANVTKAMDHDGEASFSDYSQRSGPLRSYRPRSADGTDPVEYAGVSTPHFPNTYEWAPVTRGYSSSLQGHRSRTLFSNRVDPVLPIAGRALTEDLRNYETAAPVEHKSMVREIANKTPEVDDNPDVGRTGIAAEITPALDQLAAVSKATAAAPVPLSDMSASGIASTSSGDGKGHLTDANLRQANPG